jgi:hypothetical protein
MCCIQNLNTLQRDLPGVFSNFREQPDRPFRPFFPPADFFASITFRMLVVFERKHPRPDQSIGPVDDPTQDRKHSLRLTTNSFLPLIVEGPVKTTQIDIYAHLRI